MHSVPRVVVAAAAAALVYAYLTRTELYIPSSFDDGQWRAVENDTRRKSGPFNTCSPESFSGGGCEKVPFPNLSRY